MYEPSNLTTLCLLKSWYGPNTFGSVGAKSEIVGVLTATAKWSVQVSLVISKLVLCSIDFSSFKDVFPQKF